MVTSVTHHWMRLTDYEYVCIERGTYILVSRDWMTRRWEIYRNGILDWHKCIALGYSFNRKEVQRRAEGYLEQALLSPSAM